jgi:uncharacterized membrane protein
MDTAGVRWWHIVTAIAAPAAVLAFGAWAADRSSRSEEAVRTLVVSAILGAALIMSYAVIERIRKGYFLITNPAAVRRNRRTMFRDGVGLIPVLIGLALLLAFGRGDLGLYAFLGGLAGFIFPGAVMGTIAYAKMRSLQS